MEIEGFTVECTHEHMFLIEILVDKYSLTEEKKLDEEEEEDLEEEDEDEEKDVIQSRDPADNKQIVITVQYFNLEPLDYYTHTTTDKLDELMLMKKLQMKDETDREETAKADEEREDEEQEPADEEDEEGNKRKRKKKKSTGEDIAGTMAPGHKYYSGKSCLFPLKPVELIQQIVQAPLTITLYWKEDVSNPRTLIGETDVKLGKNFIKCVAEMHGVLPTSTFIEETFKVKNNEQDAGFIRLFIRLTCFGKAEYFIC